MVADSRSLAGRRVLVTGADGFIGSHLVERLVADGAQVTALAQYNSFNSWGWLDSIDCLSQVRVETGDIRDPNFCRILARDIDTVFHLAALIPIPYSFKAPDSYIDTNVKGTLNLCQAAKDAGVQRFIHTSTSEVYGSARYVPIDESHPLTPQSPYSASKIAADAIALSFFYSFAFPVVVARPFNCFGPRQSARAVIPTIIAQLAGGMREITLGDLTTTRDFTFVEDTCRGFAAIASMSAGAGEVFHIGSNNEISIADLFGEVTSLMGVEASIRQDSARLRPAASEVLRLRCNYDKLNRACGFAPQVEFREGLRRTIEWFTSPANLKLYKAGIYNV
jgi:NAD dependent epimerase/dehydratase